MGWSQQGLVGQGSQGQWEKRKEQLLWAKNHQQNVKNNENQKNSLKQTKFKFNSLNNNELAHGFGDSTTQRVPLTHTVHGSTSPAPH